MSTTVEARSTARTDTDIMRVTVRTEDATGERREYDIGISPTSKLNDKYLIHGQRVDENAPDDEMAGGGPTSRAYEAAAKRFKAAGYEVYGHDN